MKVCLFIFAVSAGLTHHLQIVELNGKKLLAQAIEG